MILFKGRRVEKILKNEIEIDKKYEYKETKCKLAYLKD